MVGLAQMKNHAAPQIAYLTMMSMLVEAATRRFCGDWPSELKED